MFPFVNLVLTGVKALSSSLVGYEIIDKNLLELITAGCM
jgi:hypothetical protein